MTDCRICDRPIGPRERWGHTGCQECETLHLKAEIARGEADWFIPWGESDAHDSNRQASQAVREGLSGPPWQGWIDAV